MASFEWSHQISQVVTLKSGAGAILVYWSGLLLTLSTTNLDDKISLYRTNASIFEAMEQEELEHDLEVCSVDGTLVRSGSSLLSTIHGNNRY